MKSTRQEDIIRIISTREIETQEELAGELRAEGMPLKNGILTTVGFAVAACLIGTIREIFPPAAVDVAAKILTAAVILVEDLSVVDA